jgi:signal transduction histidine kinase
MRKQTCWRWLMIYLGINLVCSLVLSLIWLDVLPQSLIDLTAKTGLGLSSVVLLVLTRSALGDTRRVSLWLIGGGVWLGLFVAFEAQALLDQPTLALVIFILGWATFMVGTVQSLLSVRHSNPKPLIRARTYYWSMAVIIIAIGGVFTLNQSFLTGSTLLAFGALIFSITRLRPYMPDIRQLELSTLNYLVMTILTALVLILGAVAITYFLTTVHLNYSPVLIGAAIALLMATLLAPLWSVSHAIARRLLPQTQVDSESILRDYSQSVSNVLDPEKLSILSADHISDGLQLQHAYLFLVEQESEDGTTRYRLRGTKSTSQGIQEVGLISYNSPIADYFRRVCLPLLQTDIDSLDSFQTLPAGERLWLRSLSVEIYLPVYAKEEWIGLFAVGPKMNGMPYFEKDLSILSILVDQTSVALQNAKLVESLMRVNNDFRRAYAAMEQSNRHLKRVNIQLEGLDRTKSEFISVASHELRTPLTVMRGYNEMLLEDPKIKENPTQLKLVDGIYSGIIRLNEIVNSMLDIASIDTRTMELRVEPVSISHIIQSIQKSFANALKERNLGIDASNLSDLPPVDGDSEALRKVFNHIIINAIKYTPDGGKITITGVPVSAGQLGLVRGGIEIIISDTGIGISSENIELIFNKFYQTGNMELHSTGKTKFKGAGPGLGLAIAKGIVEAHRGLIWAESPGYNEEKLPGSTFHIVLPLHFKSQPLPATG